MGGDHKNITEPYGGDHKNITEPYGGDHKNITEPYGISGKLNQKPPTHPQAINCDRSLRDGN